MFHRILVAVDGSDAATTALGEAIDLARTGGAWLTLISVADRPRIFAGPYVVPVPDEDDLVRQAQKVLARAEALVPEDLPVVTVVERGPAAKAILERIEVGGHDLVVMGSSGLGRVEKLLLGSVSRAVVAHSPIPALIAPGASAPAKLLEDVAA
jgi:nucleotide-binding universal stress UspA family protein